MVSIGELGVIEFEEFTDDPTELQKLVFKVRALNKRVIVNHEESSVSF
jgi:hypothetical protein